jgi:hypothetical protein
MLPVVTCELVDYACNPSNSGDRDQEDHSSKSVWEISSPDPISKISNTKTGLRVAQVLEHKEEWRLH